MSDKIAIFYHVGQINHWREVYQEQLRKLFLSGLYDASHFIMCGINGNDPLPQWTPDKIIGKRNNHHTLEADTLKAMWDFARVNPGYKLLYIHTKGVTWAENPDIRVVTTKWRRFMESYVIRRWRECIRHLDTHDTCGVLYRDKAYYKPNTPEYTVLDANYYDGNFWWATSDYIATLDPYYLYTNDTPWLRGKAELWVGSKKPNAYVMHNIDYVNPYLDCDFGDANEYR